MNDSVQIGKPPKVEDINTVMTEYLNDVKIKKPAELKQKDIKFAVDDGTGRPQFDVEGKPSFKAIHEDAEAVRYLLYFKTNKDYSVEIYNHYVNEYKKLANQYLTVLDAQEKKLKNDGKRTPFLKKGQEKYQSVCKTSKKRLAMDELKNNYKKFAIMMETEDRPVGKDLHVENSNEQNGKENAYPIDLTVNSTEVKQEQYQKYMVEIPEAMGYHKKKLETRKHFQSTPKLKKSLTNNTTAMQRIPTPNDKNIIEHYLPLLPLLDVSEQNDHTYAKRYMKRVRGISLDSGIVFPDMTERLDKWKATSMPRLNSDTNLSDSIKTEFQRLRFTSDYSKECYILMKLKENPINTEYNPNKARKRLTDVDGKLAEAREKNNLASRLSRHKKKVRQQKSGFAVEFYAKEFIILIKIKKWIDKTAELAEKLAKNNGKSTKSPMSEVQDCNITI